MRRVGYQLQEGRARRRSSCPRNMPGVLGFLLLLPSLLRLQPTVLADSSSDSSQKAFDESNAPVGRPSGSTTRRRGEQRPNFLVIVCDQLRYDALGFVQRRMPSVYSSKIKVRTPNLDRLAARGIVFENAYTASPSCGPARTSLKTGCTLGRTGIVSNKMVDDINLTRSVPIFRDRIEKLVSYEQVLAQDLHYNVESYGKWHTDRSLFYTKTKQAQQAVRYTSLDWRRNRPEFVPAQTIKPIYLQSLRHLLPRAGVSATTADNLRDGQQVSKMSNLAYYPVPIDGRYGLPAKEDPGPVGTSGNNTNRARRQWRQRPRPNFKGTQVGRDSLGPNHTSTAVLGQMSLIALDRNIRQYQESATPFLLSVHFNAPHPPVIGTPVYFDYYYRNRYNLAIPASLLDPMEGSAYKWNNQRKFLLRMRNGEGGGSGGGGGGGDDDFDESIGSDEDPSDSGPASVNVSYSDPSNPNYYPYADKNRIAELTAAYYSTVEEVDAWIGRLVQRFERTRMLSNTMIVFTSDHGDMLGAHGMTGKNVLLEEAVRVPLILSAPEVWDGGRVLKRPVSHLSLFSTLLDYAGASPAVVKSSDGQSLRSFVERSSYNRDYDDDVVVVEVNGRRPVMEGNSTAPVIRLAGVLGGQPSFMVRKGNFKLFMPRMQRSHVVDMLYDLSTDPSEVSNLLAVGIPSDAVIGKAEHLKALLLEWLERHDGNSRYGGYYSSDAFQMNEGSGDISEIARRRTWRPMELWISDKTLRFGKQSQVSNSSSSSPSASGTTQYVRNEYLWAGRTAEGEAFLWVYVQGPHAAKFRVAPDRLRLGQDERARIRVTLASSAPFTGRTPSAGAYLRVKVSMGGAVSYRNVPLTVAPGEDEEEGLLPGTR